MIEPDRPARLEVVDAELRPGLSLLRSSQRRKPDDVLCISQERCKSTLKAVICGDVVEHCLLNHEWREVAAPGKRAGAGELKVCPIEFNIPALDGRLSDFSC